MDANTLLIINKLQKNESFEFKDLVLYVLVIPTITLLLTKFHKIYIIIYDYLYYKYKQWSKFNEIIIEGIETYSYDGIRYDYSSILTALVWKILKQGYKIDLKAYNTKWMKNILPIKDNLIDFSVDNTHNNWLLIEDDISFRVDRIGGDMQNSESYLFKNIIRLILRSRKHCLKEYIEKIMNEYEVFIAQKTQGKLYHFVYTGKKDEKFIFVIKCFSNLISDPNNETFDHLINEHSEKLIKDIKRLKDIKYHIRTGTSRKKGYLFWGVPGTGKTRTVLAMANYDNRHIIEIPISRIKTNQELEELIGLEEINGIKFRPDQIIYLFEEIDTADVSHKRKETDSAELSCSSDCSIKDEKKIEEINKNAELDIIKNEIKKRDGYLDLLNLGVILARLDGIGNYNGVIIVATTNHKEKLDPALYRDQRLTPINFTYCRKIDMIRMTEKYYNIKLSNDEQEKFVDRDANITPAKFRTLLETYENVNDLLLNLK